MPLMIIGLIFLIGLLVLQLVKFSQERRDFNMSTRKNRKDEDINDNEHNKTLYFPTENIEDEKHKRNIK